MAFGVDIAAQRVSTFVVAKRVSLSQKFDFFSESCPRHSQIQKESEDSSSRTVIQCIVVNIID